MLRLKLIHVDENRAPGSLPYNHCQLYSSLSSFIMANSNIIWLAVMDCKYYQNIQQTYAWEFIIIRVLKYFLMLIRT